LTKDNGGGEGMNESLLTINTGGGNTIQGKSQPTGLLSAASGSMKGREAGPILSTSHQKTDANENRMLGRPAGPLFSCGL